MTRKDMEEKRPEEERSLEENFQELEGLIDVLSDPEATLEQAFSLYSRGMELLKNCNQQIDRVEKKVLVLGGQGELEELEDQR